MARAKALRLECNGMFIKHCAGLDHSEWAGIKSRQVMKDLGLDLY